MHLNNQKKKDKELKSVLIKNQSLRHNKKHPFTITGIAIYGLNNA